jgi:hypothetical protein
MDYECTVYVPPSTDVQQIRTFLREHVILNNPPYNVPLLLQPYLAPRGRPLRIIISRGRRQVHVIDENHGPASRHVLQTAIRGFQQHRMRPSVTPHGFQALQRTPTPITPAPTKHTCSICLEIIMEHELQLLPCAHSFHQRCCQRWFRTSPTCPECRLPCQ